MEGQGAYETEYDWKDAYGIDKHFKKTYHIVKLAHYWYHQSITSGALGEVGLVVDYTKNWLNHPDENTKQGFNRVPGTWIPRNITSRELLFIDDGKQQTRYQSVYVSSEQ